MNAHLFSVSSISLKAWQLHQYSSIPYSVFKTSLVLSDNPGKIKQRLGRFHWRSNVTTLRAPKHFKVGRQHYNRSRRCSILTFCNPAYTQQSSTQPRTSVRSGVLSCAATTLGEIQQPLSVTKTVKITARLRLHLNAAL